MSSSYDPLDVRGQERTALEAKAREKQERESEQSDFKWLMGSRRGRRIIWRHLERAGVYKLTFNTNAMLMAFAEGNRNEGIRIIDAIHTLCPELYATMVIENTKGKNERHNTDAGNNRTSQ